MIWVVLAYLAGRSSGRAQQRPYMLTRKQYRKIRQPDYVTVAWRISFLITAFCLVVVLVASAF